MGYILLELYIQKPNQVVIRNVQSLSPLRGDDIKIRLIYGGICGSDLSVLRGKLQHAVYPLRPGHELLGRIIEVGEQVDYDLGTRVVIIPNTFCDKCVYCLQGKKNICSHKQSLGITIDGGFAEELTVPSKYVVPVPADLSNERAILVEPLAVVVNALKKVTFDHNTSICIVGCGTEGLLAAALADYLGMRVTAIDINPAKLTLIKEIGKIRTLEQQDIQNETFDIVIEAAGTKQSVEQAIQLVNPGGSVVLLGITNEAVLQVSHVVRNEITLYGSIIYHPPVDFLEAIEYLRDSRLNVQPVISRIIPFTEYHQAFENALSGNFAKIILDFENEEGR